MADAAPVRLDLGKVISSTFGVLGSNIVPFGILALALAGIPAVLINIGVFALVGPAMGAFTPDAMGSVFVVSMGAALIAMIPAYILVGAVTHGSIVTFNGGRASLGECLATGLRNALPLIGFGLLASLGMMLGMVLLIVPGIILAISWAVGAPVIVAEGGGLMSAFGRSAQLTKGNRWTIFFLVLIYGVLSYLIQLAVSVPFMGLMMSGGQAMALLANIPTIIYTVINSVIAACGVAALYYQLRIAKEGASSADLAKVFE